jgi:hypothetical protein
MARNAARNVKVAHLAAKDIIAQHKQPQKWKKTSKRLGR